LEEGFPAAVGGEQAFRDASCLCGFGHRARVAEERGEGRGFGDALDLAIVADAEKYGGLAFVIESVEGAALDRLAQYGLAVTADQASNPLPRGSGRFMLKPAPAPAPVSSAWPR
jgi:hypothetical protein